MNFNNHSDILGQHALLGASKYHWVNYDEDQLLEHLDKYLATQRGTILHDFAKTCIELKQKLPKSKLALNRYVNDAIGFRMTPEQPLFYSINSFGTADAISFRDSFLRIHDLKTGVSRVSLVQLEVYAALFCLEYGENPKKIEMELRIYQGDEVIEHHPEGKYIQEIMEKIVRFDKRIEKRKLEMED